MRYTLLLYSILNLCSKIEKNMKQNVMACKAKVHRTFDVIADVDVTAD